MVPSLSGTIDDGAAPPSLSDAIDDGARAITQSLDDMMADIARGLGDVEDILSADDVNLKYLKQYPTYEPPHIPGTSIYQVRLTRPAQFVRLFGGGAEQSGRWTMNLDDIIGLTAQEIQSKFSVPQVPRQIWDENVPADVVLQRSGANGILTGNGGGIQYCFIGEPSKDWFTNPRMLP